MSRLARTTIGEIIPGTDAEYATWPMYHCTGGRTIGTTDRLRRRIDPKEHHTMSDTILTTEAAVHLAHEAYLTAINSNDLARFLTTVTDDIVMMPPNSDPIAGTEAVAAWVAGYFEAVHTVWNKTTVELVVADGLAYEWYRYQSVDTPRDGGEPATDTGNGVNIYRIDADGTWRVWRDIWATAG